MSKSTKSKPRQAKQAKPVKQRPPKVVASAERAKNDERDERRLDRAARPPVPTTATEAAPPPKPQKAPKPPPPPKPMQVYVATNGGTSYVITASNPKDAREFLAKIRGSADSLKIHVIDQTKRQVWGLFPIVEVIIDGQGRVDVKRMPPAEEVADASTN